MYRKVHKKSINENNEEILKKAEQWARRLHGMPVKGFLNWSMSDTASGRYVVDIELAGLSRWISIEVQVKQGVICIPGGALISGRRSLADIHRRFN